MEEDKSNVDVAKQKRSGSGTKWPIIIVALIIVAAAGWWYYSGGSENFVQQSTAERQVPEADGNKRVSSEEATIADVVDKVSPSIVSIVTQAETRSSYWFGSMQKQGAGSGMIVGKDGLILTNKHVVENANQLQVIAGDGTIYDDAKVVAVDPLNDLAFLRIVGAKDLPIIELGDSTTVRVGQRVIAIGNSLGQYQNTVTSGIISGTGRPIVAQGSDGSAESLTDLLQTDAAINPGNSGGPLLNVAGQVIGVNTAVASNAEGISFAIPIAAAKGLLGQILAGKDAQRAFLGVRSAPVDAALAKEHSLSVARGAFVVSSEPGRAAVVAGGPADKAGIKSGDVITKIADVEVGLRGGVSSLVAQYAPGDKIEVSYVRDGRERTVTVELAAYPN